MHGQDGAIVHQFHEQAMQLACVDLARAVLAEHFAKFMLEPTIHEGDLMASFSGYGKTIKLHSGDALVVHRSQDSRVVILEYEVHGRILLGGAPYDNRFISVITIENRKIVHWRDYMDSLAAWNALTGSS